MLIYGFTVADMYHNICFVGVGGRVGGEDEEKRRGRKKEEGERRKKKVRRGGGKNILTRWWQVGDGGRSGESDAEVTVKLRPNHYP